MMKKDKGLPACLSSHGPRRSVQVTVNSEGPGPTWWPGPQLGCTKPEAAHQGMGAVCTRECTQICESSRDSHIPHTGRRFVVR